MIHVQVAAVPMAVPPGPGALASALDVEHPRGEMRASVRERADRHTIWKGGTYTVLATSGLRSATGCEPARRVYLLAPGWSMVRYPVTRGSPGALGDQP